MTITVLRKIIFLLADVMAVVSEIINSLVNNFSQET